MLKSIAFLALISFCKACELDIWVFDSLDHCTDPNETGKIIADGECRSVGLFSSFSFPGYYRATCDGFGVTFLASGCSDSSCQQCRPDGSKGPTLYQVSSSPLEIQPPLDTTPPSGRNYKCFSLSSNQGTSIYFAFYGTCSQCPIPSPPTFPPVNTWSPVAPRPIPQPTLRPTRQPTLGPTGQPTLKPTLWPTKAPTNWPSQAPVTAGPTSFPTLSPTRFPVAAPITEFPTKSPTPRPIFIVPIGIPTLVPSATPTMQPVTATPSVRPVTDTPTLRPITAQPTSLPTLSPVQPQPMESPTEKANDTLQPVIVTLGSLPNPTDGAPTPGSGTPIVSPVEQAGGENKPGSTAPVVPPETQAAKSTMVSMKLAGAGPLDEEALAAWEKVTSDHITISSGPANIRDAHVLGIEQNSIQGMAFSTGGWDPARLWDTAFDTEEKQRAYLTSLQDSHPSFANLTSITVEQKSGGSGINTIGYVLGAVGAVAALFFICVTLMAVRRIRRPRKVDRKKSSRKENADRERAVEPPVQYTNDIVLLERSPSDGMSTLGGYTNTQKEGEGDVHSVWDDPTVSVNIDYDFEKNEYKETGQNDKSLASASVDFSNASALMRLGDTLFSDDKSFEQQYVENRVVPRNPRIEPFEVIVPPGLLGMVVDSAVAGLPPVVRAIRPESILTEKVRIGDRLLSVDHQDVTRMSARAVSNAISQRANQQRVLVFARVEE